MTVFEAPVPVSPPVSPKGRALQCLACAWMALAPMSSENAFAAELTGAELAWKYNCTTCHGAEGVAKTARYPNLAGQNAPYVVARLRYFRSYAEPGNQMNAQAAPLSDDQIEALAQFFSGKSS